ncbi:MAG: GlyGly-CTERM sorting domain-containing protein [Pseudomonadota bacterium]|nr:GlyGly-CTERM sorting domain-containing protein [Pseudomonadota bacterium]
MRTKGLAAGHICVALLIGAGVSTYPQAGRAAPGDLDSDFGDGGVAVVDPSDNADSVADLARDSSDRLYLLSHSSPPGAYEGALTSANILRFDRNGHLDSAFGTDGRLSLETGDIAYLGIAYDESNQSLLLTGQNFAQRIVVSRLNLDGSLDPEFGESGTVSLDVAGFGGGYVPHILPDGRIMVAGVAGENTVADDRPVLARLNADGGLDESFGDGGIARLPYLSYGQGIGALSVDTNGESLVCAPAPGTNAGMPGVAFPDDGVYLARVTASGRVDDSFGEVGTQSVDLEGRKECLMVRALKDDGIAVGAIAASTLTVAKLTGDGSLDAAFGEDGIQQDGVDLPYFGGMRAVAQSEGRFVFAASDGLALTLIRVEGSELFADESAGTPTGPNGTEDSGNSSGGTMGWFLLLLAFAAHFARRREACFHRPR